MKLLAGFLIGGVFGDSRSNPFPRTPSKICKVDIVYGRSCIDVKRNDPNAATGVYKIQPGRSPVIVDCVFEDSFAYTVMQKRTTGKLSFSRSWRDYKEGFTSWTSQSLNSRGPRPGAECTLEEYWIGLDNIYALTQTMDNKYLRVDLERFKGQIGRISYDNFQMSDERDNYRLNGLGFFANDNIDVGNAFQGAGFGLQGYSPRDKFNTNHIGMEFSTYDNDNDKYWGNCGQEDSSGWWFNRCSAANLNGKHYGMGSSAEFNPNAHGFDDGILWQTWTNNKFESLTATRMMVTNSNQRNPTPAPIPPKSQFPKTCNEIALKLWSDKKLTTSTRNGFYNGIYEIQDSNGIDGKEVECKIVVCGGKPAGWTLIQHRYDGSLDFNRNWNEYKTGFGFTRGGVDELFRGPRPDTLGEGWLGNELIHKLTEGIDPRGVSLFIEMQRKTEQDVNGAMVGYERFGIGNERDQYVLNHIDQFQSLFNENAGNAFLGDDFGKQGFGNDQADTNHHGMKFSTKDRDNDNIEEFHCGAEDVSGWWFNACSAANLNGHYYNAGFIDRADGRKPARGQKEYDDGILWNTWTHDKWESLVTTKMWISAPGHLSQCSNNPDFNGSKYNFNPRPDVSDYERDEISSSYESSFSNSRTDY